MIFTNKEIEILNDKELLVTKTIVINKIQDLFEEVRNSLHESMVNLKFEFPQEVDIKIGKIFRGENYQMLPFVNMDYPKVFKGNDIFTFRTMFLWGSFFSSTLHLSGKYFAEYKNNIMLNLENNFRSDIYICINESPWHYHYGKDNYIKLTIDNIHLIQSLKFLKLSIKHELKDYKNLPKLSSSYLEYCINML